MEQNYNLRRIKSYHAAASVNINNHTFSLQREKQFYYGRKSIGGQ